jgi:ATP-dependent DNA helicase RecQ
VHALVLDFLEENDENQLFDSLLDFISELTYRDDGQLYKIYEKHIERVSDISHETEIVLTTMHKVKGLEFDAVMITPSISNLPLKVNEISTQNELQDQLEEEKRLAYVSYTRARYRLIIFRDKRELALMSNKSHVFSEDETITLGVPVQPEIKKLKIGWAAKAFNFKGGVNEFINSNIKSGDFILVKKRSVSYNGSVFTVNELFKSNSTKPIGELANHSNFMNSHYSLTGFVVNEVVVWTYDDTCKFDSENGTNFARDWCPEAMKKGFIYLVDFAGYGVPST